MSHTSHQPNSTEPKAPRAIIHKNILDVAEESPDASYEALADEVSGASVALVEQVIEEYGDPAEDESAANESDTPSATTESGDAPTGLSQETGDGRIETQCSTNALTDKQLETFRAIAVNPQATQAEIAEALDVSPATVCTRVNQVDDFEWKHREEFVSNVVGNGKKLLLPTDSTNEKKSELAKQVARHSDQLNRLERQFHEFTWTVSNAFKDSELALKVIQACAHSEQITEDEELQIIKAIVGDE